MSDALNTDLGPAYLSETWARLEGVEPESRQAEVAVDYGKQGFVSDAHKFALRLAGRAMQIRYAYGPGSADAEEEVLEGLWTVLHLPGTFAHWYEQAAKHVEGGERPGGR